MSWAYAAALAVSIGGMAVLDRRFRLVMWADPRRGAVVLGAGVAFWLAWDLVGVGTGVFFRGQTSAMTGVLVAPEVPVEELGFLTLLGYLTLLCYVAAARWVARRGSGRGAGRVARRGDGRR